jgi:hypothetical protein
MMEECNQGPLAGDLCNDPDVEAGEASGSIDDAEDGFGSLLLTGGSVRTGTADGNQRLDSPRFQGGDRLG